jgi:hypothetical protein
VAAWTLDRALVDLEQDELPERTVVVFDEAGMAATRASERLLAAAQQAGAKVIAVGDPGQLSSVQAGGWMRAVGERVGVQRLTQVVRQRDLGERRALAQLHDGRPEPYCAGRGSRGASPCTPARVMGPRAPRRWRTGSRPSPRWV